MEAVLPPLDRATPGLRHMHVQTADVPRREQVGFGLVDESSNDLTAHWAEYEGCSFVHVRGYLSAIPWSVAVPMYFD